MQLDQPGDSPFDLRFRIFRVPVRVHWMFWLTAVFLGWYNIGSGVEYLLLWVACMFFSILMHELGHVWMGWLFGSRGHILLQGLGGLAFGASSIHGRGRRILVYLAGPGIQLLIFGLLLSVLMLVNRRDMTFWQTFRAHNLASEALERLPPEHRMAILGRNRVPDLAENFSESLSDIAHQPNWYRLAQAAVSMLLMINLWWAIINLMPIWPLDGGQVARELFLGLDGQRGVRNSLALSVVTGLVLTINSISGAMQGPTIPNVPSGEILFIFLFGALTFNCFMMLQMEQGRLRGGGYRDPEEDDRLPWERDPDEWKGR